MEEEAFLSQGSPTLSEKDKLVYRASPLFREQNARLSAVSAPNIKYSATYSESTDNEFDENEEVFSVSAPPLPRSFSYVKIVVSGYIFQTFEETLLRYPDTLLGSLNSDLKLKYYNEDKGAYIFHRCRQCFESILYFYQSNGSLVQPINVEQNTFLDEARFFRLPVLDALKLDIEPKKEYKPDSTHTDFVERLHTMVKDDSSLGWKALALFDVGMTFVYVILQLIRTTPQLSDKDHEVQVLATEWICIIWFSSIFTLRFYIATERIRFVRQFMSIIDLSVILTFIIDFGLYLNLNSTERTESKVRAIITCIRVVGLLRLFNIARYSELLFCLGVALKRSLADLAQVMVLIFLITFIFATLAYYIEEESGTFVSVFEALYWGTITITTVGYGDIYPKTTGGKFVGATLALLGLPLIAIPMPLIMSKFDAYYRTIKKIKENNDVRDRILAGNQMDEDERILEERQAMCWMEHAAEAFDYGENKRGSYASRSKMTLSFSDLSHILGSNDSLSPRYRSNKSLRGTLDATSLPCLLTPEQDKLSPAKCMSHTVLNNCH